MGTAITTAPAAEKRWNAAVLNTHPIQYFAPLYAHVNAHTPVRLTALYLSDMSMRGAVDPGFGGTVKWDIDLLAGYPSQFVGERHKTRDVGGFTSMVAPELWGLIRKARFDALIVHGYAVAANLVAIAAANSVGTPVLMRGETHLGLSRVQLSGPKSQAIRTVLSRCSAFLAIGSANAAYYRAMGIAPERIFLTPYTIDNDRFARMSAMDPDMRAQARRDLGVEDAHPILLYAAKFQRRKHPDDVLRAAAKLKAEGLQFHVAMVGSGEMAGELKSLTQSLGLDNVRFHGFVNQSLLPRVYAACDAFILPSEEEPWGLAVNEAMACGLPVVVSAEVGCVPDLVTPGVSGQTFQAGDVDGLADALRPLTADAAYRQRMAAGARDAINRWSYREASAGIQAAIEFVQRKKAA